MIKSHKTYLTKIIILSAMIFIAYLVLIYSFPNMATWNFLYFFSIFPVVNILFHLSITKQMDNASPHQKFINKYMASTVIKLFLYMIIMLVYVLVIKYQAIQFIIGFFVCYLIYTFFEIYTLMKLNKAKEGGVL